MEVRDDRVLHIDFGRDTIVCSDKNLVLRSNERYDHYLWSDGDTTPTKLAVPGNTYAITVTRHDCIGQDTIVLDTFQWSVVMLPKKVVYCKHQGDDIRIEISEMDSAVDINSGDKFYTEIKLPMENAFKDYLLYQNGCSRNYSVSITDTCESKVWIPDAISINFDQINDGFHPVFSNPDALTYYSLEIYDRWGGLQFKSGNPMEKWSPKGFVGVVAFYRLQYRTIDERNVNIKSGTITLLK